MQDQKSKPKRRTPPWILGGIVLILLTFLILFQSSGLLHNFTIESAGDTLALYALLSLNFIAFVIFAFILSRSLLKLQRERRALQLGSKLKSKLLFYFVAISILPIIAMAFFSYLFMNRALERWFARIPDNLIQEAKDVQAQAVKDQNIKSMEIGRIIVGFLNQQEINQATLLKITEEGNLTYISVISNKGEILAKSEKILTPDQKNELDKVIELVNQNKLSEPILQDGSGFDAVITDFADGRKIVIVPDFRPKENISQSIAKSEARLNELKESQNSVRLIGLSIIGLITFLLIFASSWTAFHVARGLTVPIKALAEGADEIAHGNFSHRVDVLAEDELALLVTIFNQMAATLQSNSHELSERRKYIETVLESLPTGVISFDAKDRVTTINKAAILMLKLENANFENFALSTIVSVENQAVLEKLINRAKRIGQAAEQTILLREHADGSSETNENIPVALTATALPDKSGVVLVIEDLTELLQAQRASAWSEVARRMAHEIKNPLTPIQLSAERIAKRFTSVVKKSKVQSILDVFKPKSELTDNQIEEQNIKVIKDGTETILREVNALKSMVDEFARFARLPNVKLENGDLNELLKQAVNLYEDRFADVKINTELAENLPESAIDQEQLKRVFVNLIDNSIEAFDNSQADKEILVKTWHDKARDLIIAEVSDNGNGITPSDFQKLFQPYFSTKGRGTGLGLAIVQRIISEHGGKIRAVNNSTKGAKFIIELPVITG